MNRKVIQISTTQNNEDLTVIVALCDDGTMWTTEHALGIGFGDGFATDLWEQVAPIAAEQQQPEPSHP